MYLNIIFLFFLLISFQSKATNCEVENEIVLSKGTCIGEIKYSTGEKIKTKFVDGVADGYAEVTYGDDSKYNGTVSNNLSEGYAIVRKDYGFIVGTYLKDNFSEGIIKYNDTFYITRTNNDDEKGTEALLLDADDEYVYVGGLKDYQKHGDGVIYVLKDSDKFKKGDYYIDNYANGDVITDYKVELEKCSFDETGYVNSKKRCFADENVNDMRSVGIFENKELKLGFIYYFTDSENYIHIGQFNKFELNGYGFESDPDLKFFHAGQYRNGNPNGYSINKHSDNETRFYGIIDENFEANGIGYEVSTNGDTFFGIYRNNIPFGYGERYFNNGTYYKGNLNGDKFDGLFEILFDNNDLYHGQIKNTKFNGFGYYKYSNGDIEQGLWKDDDIVEELVFCKKFDKDYYYNAKNIGCNDNEEISVQEFLQYETNFENYKSWSNAFLDDFIDYAGDELVLENCIIDDGRIITDEKCWANELEYGNFIYTGALVNKMMNGTGELIITSGELKGQKYVGNFVDDIYEGEGTYTYPNGNYYVGEFKNDKFDGYGIYYYLSGEEEGDIYEGYYKEGYKHGQGKYTYAEGIVVEGQYKKGNLEGIFYINGEEAIYKNDEIIFLNDLEQDKIAESVVKNCEIVNNQISTDEECKVDKFKIEDHEYTGTILNKKKHGNVFEINIEGEFIGNSYSGEYRNGEFHGQGIYNYKSGDKYEGNFRFGAFDGYGIFYYNSGEEKGDIYEGFWKSGLENGQGTLTFANGVTLRDEWVDGDVDGIFFLNDEPAKYEGDIVVYLNDEDINDIEQNEDDNEFKSNIDDDEIIPASSGSGFFINEKGTIVTNFHVIDYCNQVNMHYKGEIKKLTLLAQDRVNDLAILSSNTVPDDYFAVSSEDASLLDEVYVAGFPFGKSLSSSVKVTKGVVSSLSGLGDNFGEIQIDAALQSGNSGGPIIDNYGNVIGVAVSKLDLDYAMENFGNIPENTNFGVKSSILNIFAKSNQIKLTTPAVEEISSRDIGKKITNATVYLDCMMTEARIEEVKSRKVLFDD